MKGETEDWKRRSTNEELILLLMLVLLIGSENRAIALPVRLHRAMFLFVAAAPLGFHSHNSVFLFHFAMHREGHIRFALEERRDKGKTTTRRQVSGTSRKRFLRT